MAKRTVGEVNPVEIEEYIRNHEVSKIVDKFHLDLRNVILQSVDDMEARNACLSNPNHDSQEECDACQIWVRELVKFSFMLGVLRQSIQDNSLNKIEEMNKYLELKMKKMGISFSQVCVDEKE